MSPQNVGKEGPDKKLSVKSAGSRTLKKTKRNEEKGENKRLGHRKIRI